MEITISAETNMGMKRTNNEDLGLVQSELVIDTSIRSTFDLSSDAPIIAAVADGMGGRDNGEVASMMVIDALREWRESVSADATVNDISSSFNLWVSETNRKLRNTSTKTNLGKCMGSTLVGMVFTHNAIVGFNTGDSRLYRFRNGWLRQISKDHSQKQLSGDENMKANIIYNCFGAVKDTFADYFNISTNVNKGDIFLLCSDGLWEMVSDDMMEELLNSSASVSQFIEAANQRGGKDNVTVALIRIS